MKKLFLLFALITLLSQLKAQVGTNEYLSQIKTGTGTNEDYYRPVVNLGIGVGIDYGGLPGIRLTYLPSRVIGLFGALGYNFLGTGVNVGGFFKLAPEANVSPYIGAMYGYNAVIKIIGAEKYNKVYYGPSFTLGFELWQKNRPNYFNLEFLIPIRSSDFKSDFEEVKADSNIILKTEPLPLAISLGFHIGF